KDPENRLLARGPRFRLSAEAIRDQALVVSGLFAERIGGPSVKPYQPAGLWGELGSGDMLYGDYHHDKGPNLYRRGLYTFWKRTVPAPSMMTFDAAGREMCVVRETRTNTPLQALNLMNDVTFVEAARVLAQRIMTEAGPTPAERITLAFRLATARLPRPTELQVLVNGLQQHQSEYRKNPKAALKLVSMGEYPRNEKLDVAELAAYTAVAGQILNVDETITKEGGVLPASTKASVLLVTVPLAGCGKPATSLDWSLGQRDGKAALTLNPGKSGATTLLFESIAVTWPPDT